MPRQKSSGRLSGTPKVPAGTGTRFMVRVAAGQAQRAWLGVVRGKRIEVGTGSIRLRSLRGAWRATFEHTPAARLGGDSRAALSSGGPDGHPLGPAAGGSEAAEALSVPVGRGPARGAGHGGESGA